MKQVDKPKLGRFDAFIDLKDIVVEGEGTEDETRRLIFDLYDDFHFFPDPWNADEVHIEFDGGYIEVTRERFYEALAKYEETYKKRIHHSAIDELIRACESIKDVKVRDRHKAALASLKTVLDKTREA